MKARHLVLLGMALFCFSCSDSHGPETGDKEVRQAIALYERNQVIDALEMFQSAAAKPLQVYDSWEVYNYIGVCYLDLDIFEKALTAFNRSLEENTQSHNVWVNKGVALRKLGRTDEAEECYREALALNPDYAELHTSLGSLHVVRDNPREAVKCFKKAIELNPSLAVTHANFAIALGMLGDFPGADAELKAAARLGYANVQAVRERIDMMRSNLDTEPSRQQGAEGDAINRAP